MRFECVLILFALCFAGCTTPEPSAKFGEPPVNVYQKKLRDTDFDINHDTIELDPRFADIFEKIDDEVEKELKNRERHIGFIHVFWHTKKKLLKRKYKIEWRSPGELNDEIHFD